MELNKPLQQSRNKRDCGCGGGNGGGGGYQMDEKHDLQKRCADKKLVVPKTPIAFLVFMQ